jgi:hypothetical protein
LNFEAELGHRSRAWASIKDARNLEVSKTPEPSPRTLDTHPLSSGPTTLDTHQRDFLDWTDTRPWTSIKPTIGQPRSFTGGRGTLGHPTAHVRDLGTRSLSPGLHGTGAQFWTRALNFGHASNRAAGRPRFWTSTTDRWTPPIEPGPEQWASHRSGHPHSLDRHTPTLVADSWTSTNRARAHRCPGSIDGCPKLLTGCC